MNFITVDLYIKASLIALVLLRKYSNYILIGFSFIIFFCQSMLGTLEPHLIFKWFAGAIFYKFFTLIIERILSYY